MQSTEIGKLRKIDGGNPRSNMVVEMFIWSTFYQFSYKIILFDITMCFPK